MKLYLMRHCDPVPGARNDSSRGLTPEGVAQAHDMADFLRRQIGTVDVVITSPLHRAEETALIMAHDLGCHQIKYTSALDPSGTAPAAWHSIQAHTGKSDGEVLVVTHHPLIGDLVELLTGAKTHADHFTHGTIAHTLEGKMIWLVTPPLVERDDETLAAAADVAEAAIYTMAQVDKESLTTSESLKHWKHAVVLEPIRADAKAVLARFFKRQGRAFLTHSAAHLQQLGDTNTNVREAGQPAKDAIGYVLPDGSTLPIPLTGGMSADYSKALEAALTSGYEGLALENASEGEMGADPIAEYLREHSLQKLTGNIAAETTKQLRNAMAEAYEDGADYEEMKDAIKGVFERFSDVRAGMIAQTESNNAYNAGRKQLGQDLGFNEKAWNPDGMACLMCLENVAAGWIPMEDFFPSGDDAPTAHVNCDCSLDVRLAAQN